MAKKEDNEQQKDVQNKAQAAMKEGLQSALGQKGPKGADPSAAPTPKPGIDGQKSDKSASPTPKPKPGGGGEKNDMMKNLLKAGLDVLQGKDPTKHLNKALKGMMPGGGGGPGANMDKKAGKGPMDMMNKNPMGKMLKSATKGMEGPGGGGKGGPPKGKPPVKPSM